PRTGSRREGPGVQAACHRESGGRQDVQIYFLASKPRIGLRLVLNAATVSAALRSAHLGTTVSLMTFLSSSRSASVGLTRVILPLTGCVQASAPVLQS